MSGATPTLHDFVGVLPEAILAVAFIALMLLDLVVPPARRSWLAAFSVLALLGTLVAFIVVCVGVLILRYTRPDLRRPFRAPAIWFTAL